LGGCGREEKVVKKRWKVVSFLKKEKTLKKKSGSPQRYTQVKIV